MAGVKLTVSTPVAVALASATAKTVLQIKAPAAQRLRVFGLSVSGAMSAGGTDAAVQARLTRNSTAFGTGTTATPYKSNPSQAEAIQSTAFYNFSAEPTTPTDAAFYQPFNPESGIIVMFPPEMYLEVPGGQSLQLELKSISGTPNVYASFFYEE